MLVGRHMKKGEQVMFRRQERTISEIIETLENVKVTPAVAIAIQVAVHALENQIILDEMLGKGLLLQSPDGNLQKFDDYFESSDKSGILIKKQNNALEFDKELDFDKELTAEQCASEEYQIGYTNGVCSVLGLVQRKRNLGYSLDDIIEEIFKAHNNIFNIEDLN